MDRELAYEVSLIAIVKSKDLVKQTKDVSRFLYSLQTRMASIFEFKT